MKILVLSCSLHRRSRSRVLARLASERLAERGAGVTFLDLRDHPLPLCDGGAPDAPALDSLKDAISGADAILLGAPIYNYDVNAAAKNMIELTSRAWTDKIVSFVCAAGGKGSYMSVMALANSLMLDFRCLVLPRFVYVTGAAFDESLALEDAAVAERLDELCDELVRVTGALA